MIFLLLFSFLIPISTGLAIVKLLLDRYPEIKTPFLLKISLSVGLGLGFFSCLSFLWLLIFGPFNRGFVVADLIICLGTISLYVIQRISYPQPATPFSNSSSSVKVHWLIKLCFYVLLGYALLTFILLFLINPHGFWDAWAIWNTRARFLFRGPEYWSDAFSPFIISPDYPLLIPLTIARSWYYIKQETQLVPGLISLLFTFSTVGLMVSAQSTLRTKTQGYLAGMVLMGTPFLVFHGVSQYADVPLGFFYFSVIVLFYLHDQTSKSGYGLLFLAGLMAGFAGWTKNEGLLFTLSIPLARLAVPKQTLKAYSMTMLFFVIGLLPVLLIILIFKTRLAPLNYLFSQGTQGLLPKLMDLSRYFQILKAFGLNFINFGLFPKLSLIPILGLYACLLGFSIRKNWRNIRAPLILLGLVSAGYFIVFLCTTFELAFQLRTALGRLFLHLWPSALFIYFIIVNTPTFSKKPIKE
ncbi:MAG: hypothetical protein WA974_03550 [Thermodesulfobacteriota bacterium]